MSHFPSHSPIFLPNLSFLLFFLLRPPCYLPFFPLQYFILFCSVSVLFSSLLFSSLLFSSLLSSSLLFSFLLFSSLLFSSPLFSLLSSSLLFSSLLFSSFLFPFLFPSLSFYTPFLSLSPPPRIFALSSPFLSSQLFTFLSPLSSCQYFRILLRH